MNREDQKRAPIYEALEKFRKQRVVHSMCRGISGAVAILN